MSKDIIIRIIYDNFTYKADLEADHGFSCLVEIENRKVLFDTGTDGNILLNNLEKLNINLKTISKVVLSHAHYDHTGGLEKFLERNNNVTVYLLSSFPREIKQTVLKYNASLLEVSELMKINENIYSTGELGTSIKEQSLIIKSPKGVIVVTGCAHPGIVDIVKFVKNKFNEKIHLVMGGFHLIGYSERELIEICGKLKEAEISKVMPCHCTGELAIEVFKREFSTGYERCGVGRVLKV